VSYYFTTQFLNLLKTGWTTPLQVRMYLFPQAPSLIAPGEGDNIGTTTAYAGINKVDTLKNTLGWGSYYASGPTRAVTKGTVGTRQYASIADDVQFDLAAGTATTPVQAIAFCLDKGSAANDDIMFVTDTPLPQGVLMHAGDGVVPIKDDNLASKRVLFYWDPAGPVSTDLPNAYEGKLVLTRSIVPSFETARTQHVWIYPQRLNLIANPSFELNTAFWRTSSPTGSIAQLSDAPAGGGNKSGRVTGTALPVILESDIFPLRHGNRRQEYGVTIQLQARYPSTAGAGILKVGLVTWDADYAVSRVDWGNEKLNAGETTPSHLIGGGFVHIRTTRDIGEGVSGMLRLEFKPQEEGASTGVFDVDQVCVEPGLMPANGNDWPYFDGDSEYGAREDFSWYGGTVNRNASYSCWYNLRTSTFGRLFAQHVDQTPATLTDDEAEQQGLAYQWVPAGTPVIGHLNVLYPHDPMWDEPRPMVPYAGPVLAYRTAAAPSLQNIVSPW
jgi:hypothetical protein